MYLTDIDKFVVFDTETTGIDRENDRIVTAYAGLMGRDGNLIGSRSWIIDPGIEIPEGAAAVHGISTERARAEGADPSVAIHEIVALLEGRISRGTPIVAYNGSFDYTLTDRESRRYGGPGFPTTDGFLAIDPFIIDKRIDKWRKGKRKLEITAAHYGVELLGAHDAEADAVATGRVAWAVLDKVIADGTLEQMGLEPTLANLHAQQILWAEEQGVSLQEYLRRADESVVVDWDWPFKIYVKPVDDTLDNVALEAAFA